MKKYIAPAIKVADVKNETILAGSDIRMGKYSDQSLLGRGRKSMEDYEDEFEEDFE